MQIGATGIRIGDVLQQFEGVLTGVPRFRGKGTHLLNEQNES
jgi:hypothetical protein